MSDVWDDEKFLFNIQQNTTKGSGEPDINVYETNSLDVASNWAA